MVSVASVVVAMAFTLNVLLYILQLQVMIDRVPQSVSVVGNGVSRVNIEKQTNAMEDMIKKLQENNRQLMLQVETYKDAFNDEKSKAEDLTTQLEQERAITKDTVDNIQTELRECHTQLDSLQPVVYQEKPLSAYDLVEPELVPTPKLLCHGEANQAPCQSDSRLLYAVEYDYPPFWKPMPLFIDESDREWFLNSLHVTELREVSDRCPKTIAMCAEPFDSKEKLAYYTERHTRGAVYTVKNGVYSGTLDCGWFSDYKFLTRGEDPSPHYDEVVNLVIPDGWSFQHFLDGVFPKLVAVWDVIQQNKSHLLTDRIGHGIIGDIYEHIGIEKSRLLSGLLHESAKRFHFSCVTPPIHPWLWQRMQQLMGVRQIPYNHRNKIVYLSRDHGTANPGRHILNEADLILAIQNHIKNRNEEFEIFNHADFVGKVAKNVEYFNRAKVIIGPHGGAFYNQLFAPRDTLIIEFVPIYRNQRRPTLRHPAKMIWTVAALTGQKYYQLPTDAEGGDGDMHASIDKVINILKKEL